MVSGAVSRHIIILLLTGHDQAQGVHAVIHILRLLLPRPIWNSGMVDVEEARRVLPLGLEVVIDIVESQRTWQQGRHEAFGYPGRQA